MPTPDSNLTASPSHTAAFVLCSLGMTAVAALGTLTLLHTWLPATSATATYVTMVAVCILGWPAGLWLSRQDRPFWRALVRSLYGPLAVGSVALIGWFLGAWILVARPEAYRHMAVAFGLATCCVPAVYTLLRRLRERRRSKP